MIIEENEMTNSKKDMSQLIFNIQTKLSLLGEIQKNTLQNQNQFKQSPVKEAPSYEEINLPMQLLNKKMHEIINQKSPLSEKRSLKNQNELRTFQRKKLNLNELQTATRNIEELKRNPKQIRQNHSEINFQESVREFSHNNNQTEHSMTESMLESGSNSKNSSKIVTKFNQIQLNYTEKIKTLTFKLSFLEQKLSESEEQKKELLQSLETYKLLYSRKQEEIQKEIQKRLEQVKDKLIEKFAEECRLKYNEYVTELKESNNQLNEERKKRKFYEEQNNVLKLEKQNYGQMYKSLAQKQKLWLKLDIDNTKNQLFSNHSAIDFSAKQDYRKEQSSYLMVDRKYEKNQEMPQEIEEYSQIHKLTNQEQGSVIHKEQYYTQWESQKAKAKLSIQKPANRSLQKSKEKSSLSKSKDKSTSNNKKQPPSQKKKKEKQRLETETDALKSSATKKPNKHKKSLTANQMTKQQLIPFLAQGIQELKQRLRMK